MLKRIVLGFFVLALTACGESKGGDISDPFFPSITTDRTVELKGLKDRVEVLHDEQGVPHIYATNEADAALIQGYITARDRFFQMEIIRKAASGRISELFGKLDAEATRNNDLETRRINLTERGTLVFDELPAALDPSEQHLLNMYAAGINSWVKHAQGETNGAKEPFQYEKNPFIKSQGILFADVAEWTPADSLAIGRYQQWNLSGSLGDELSLGRIRMNVPVTIFTETHRFAPADPTVTLDDFFNTPPAFTGLSVLSGVTTMDTLTAAERKAFALQLEDTYNSIVRPGRSLANDVIDGSNNWVVGPKMTGKNAILANDPHLTIINPPLFYNTHLNTSRFGKGKWDSIGVTFPGIPGLLIGHNPNVAWGVTTLGYDVMDLYKEDFDGKNVTFKGKKVPLAISKQKLQFGMGEGATVEDIEIPYVPHHGAVVSGFGALEGKDEDLVTMKWTGRETTTDFRSFFNLLSARNIDEFFEAVHYFDVGAQSFVGADVEGNIGYFGHALVPRRNWNLEQNTPDAPLPGSGDFEWAGYLDDGELVQAKNPAKGYIATANNDIVGTTLDNNPFNDKQYFWFWEDMGFRIGRISQLIEELAPITIEDMEAIQNDVYSLEAERVVPRLLDLLAGATLTPEQQTAVGYLSTWSYQTPTGVKGEFRKDEPTAEEKADAVASSIYFRFQGIFRNKIISDDWKPYGENGPGSGESLKFMIYALENTNTTADTVHWFNDIGTPGVVETPQDLIKLALDEAITDLTTRFKTSNQAEWLWGNIHQVEGVDVVGLVTDKSKNSNGPTPNDGAQHTVDVAGFNGDFIQGSGSQVRFVAEMEKDKIVSRSMIPGGQVDDPDSPHNADQWDNWVTNERLPYRFYDKDIEANVESKWVFLPTAP